MKYYGKVFNTFLKKMFLFRQNHSRNILKTLQKYFARGYKETFQKDFLYYCLKYCERFEKDFLGKFFYKTENVKKFFRNLAKIYHERL